MLVDGFDPNLSVKGMQLCSHTIASNRVLLRSLLEGSGFMWRYLIDKLFTLKSVANDGPYTLCLCSLFYLKPLIAGEMKMKLDHNSQNAFNFKLFWVQ